MGNVVKMPSADAIRKAYSEGQGRAGTRYKEKIAGVTNEEWKAAAKDGQALYVAQVTDPVNQARRLTNINKTNDWQKMALEKGSVRIAAGMKAGEDKRAANYEPIRGGLHGLAIPARSTDWRANLTGRAGAVIEAQKKAAGKS